MLPLIQSATAALLAVAVAALAAPSARQRPETTPLLALVGVLLALVVSGWTGVGAVVVIRAGFAAVPILAALYARTALEGESLHRTDAVHLVPPLVALALAALGSMVWMLALTALGLGYGAWTVRLWLRSERPSTVGVPLAVFGTHWVLSIGSGLVWFLDPPAAVPAVLEGASLVALAAFAGVVAVSGLRRHPALEPPPPAPYADGLEAAERAGLASRLRALVETDQPHLDPDLTALSLAERLGASPRELSEILTVEFESGFYDFVNGLRVDEAKRLLADPSRADSTVLEILFEAGFSSKSAFHRAFKARAGQTPSAYRRAAQASGDGQSRSPDGLEVSVPASGRA